MLEHEKAPFCMSNASQTSVAHISIREKLACASYSDVRKVLHSKCPRPWTAKHVNGTHIDSEPTVIQKTLKDEDSKEAHFTENKNEQRRVDANRCPCGNQSGS
jgi:hypothetical protein